VIFVDQTTDTSLFSDAVLVEINWLGQGFQRRGCAQSAVGAVLIVVGLVLGEDLSQVGLVPDEGAVQEFAAASADPAFGDGVHPWRLDIAEHGPDPGVGENGVKSGGEVGAAVADHELDPAGLVADVHDQVAGLLGGPFPGGVHGDAEDADAPGGVLDGGQDVGLGAAGQVGCEEVAGQDRVGLGAQEL